MAMEYLVTGGCGFIGSNLVRYLAQHGRKVRVLDNLATGNRRNIEDLLDRGSVEFLHGDVRDVAAVHQACAGIRYVLHAAALPSVVVSVENPVLSNAVNLDGTLNLLVASRDAGVDRFVFSSSSAIYGDGLESPKREDLPPAPLSPYAAQKLAGEYYERIFHSLYGLKTFALRYFNVFGPRQNPKSQYAAVVPLFIEALKAGRAPVIFGDGEQTRDFVFVEDVVRANLACCEASAEVAGGIFNIARGQRMTVNELAGAVARVMGCPGLRPVHAEARLGDVRDSVADVTRAQKLLRWTPQVDFEEGLRHTVEWFVHEPG